jgi:hypothetical protein
MASSHVKPIGFVTLCPSIDIFVIELVISFMSASPYPVFLSMLALALSIE